MCEIILSAGSSHGGRSTRSRMLRKAGYEVLEAGADLDALGLAVENKPDLIVIDDLDGSGFALCRRIKDNPIAAHIPAIAICSPRARRQWRGEHSAELLLPETASPRVLVSVIRLLLQSRAAAAQGGESRDGAGIHGIVRLKRELEASVTELARENERLMRCNQDLSGSVPLKAHDLLSPLCTISFVSAWIAGEYGDRLGVSGREYFKLLEKSVERVIAVVNRVTIRSQASGRSKVA